MLHDRLCHIYFPRIREAFCLGINGASNGYLRSNSCATILLEHSLRQQIEKVLQFMHLIMTDIYRNHLFRWSFCLFWCM